MNLKELEEKYEKMFGSETFFHLYPHFLKTYEHHARERGDHESAEQAKTKFLNIMRRAG
jgi:hypothetical protein